MGIFDKLKEPVILKEDSSATEHQKQLEQLLEEVENAKIKAQLEHDIAAVNAGIYGENIILFELKNSHIPMYVLHDLYLKQDELSAQIDFLVITKKLAFIIECKNLYGDIIINSTGDFLRIIGNRKEGIYSPFTQGKRHLELIKQIRSAEKSNFITRSLFEHNFYENYQSVVVMANPKTVLDAKYAPKEIKSQVIRADHLIDYIQKVNAESGTTPSSDSDMEELAKFYLSKHQACKTDFTEKYRKALAESAEPDQSSPEVSEPPAPLCPKCGAPMIKRRATRGDKVGSEFWGCSKFPQCRSIINIS